MQRRLVVLLITFLFTWGGLAALYSQVPAPRVGCQVEPRKISTGGSATFTIFADELPPLMAYDLTISYGDVFALGFQDQNNDPTDGINLAPGNLFLPNSITHNSVDVSSGEIRIAASQAVSSSMTGDSDILATIRIQGASITLIPFQFTTFSLTDHKGQLLASNAYERQNCFVEIGDSGSPTPTSTSTSNALSPLVSPTPFPPGFTPSVTPTYTPTPPQTPSPLETPIQTTTPSILATPADTATATPTFTALPTATPTYTDTPLPSPTPTETPTATEIVISAPTSASSSDQSPLETPQPTDTETPVSAETPTEAPTETPTETPTDTPLPADTATDTPTATETPLLDATAIPTLTPEPPTPAPVVRPTPTPVLQINRTLDENVQNVQQDDAPLRTERQQPYRLLAIAALFSAFALLLAFWQLRRRNGP